MLSRRSILSCSKNSNKGLRARSPRKYTSSQEKNMVPNVEKRMARKNVRSVRLPPKACNPPPSTEAPSGSQKFPNGPHARCTMGEFAAAAALVECTDPYVSDHAPSKSRTAPWTMTAIDAQTTPMSAPSSVGATMNELMSSRMTPR